MTSIRDKYPLAWLSLLPLAPIAIFFASFAGMVDLWSLSGYQYCYFVPFISAWLIYRDRQTISAIQFRFSLRGAIVCLLSVGLWSVGLITDIQAIEHIALGLILVSWIWTMTGDEIWRVAYFPLLFLLTAVPVTDIIVPTLQMITADISTLLLQMFGVPAVREGMFITLAGGHFEVAEACSGIKYLNAGVVLALLISHDALQVNLIRAIYVAVAGIILIFLNAVRAFLIMVIASGSEMRYLTGDDHIYFGYLIFAIAVITIFALAGGFRHLESRRTISS